MRILVLAPQWPDPPRQGAAIRNLQILLYLAKHHQVTLLTFTPTDGSVDLDRLTALCEHVELFTAPKRHTIQRLRTLVSSRLPDMAHRLKSTRFLARAKQLHTERPFDAVHIEGIEMAPYALALLRQSESRFLVCYDAHNAEYLIQKRAAITDLRHPRRLPQAVYSLLQWRRLMGYERKVLARSNHILAVSRDDVDALVSLAPDSRDRITLLPNGVDPEEWSPAAVMPTEDIEPGSEVLVFDGTMDYRPNVDAATWLVNEVWPLIRGTRSLARLYIVGRNPSPAVVALAAAQGVTITGAVDDTRRWVASATVYLVPMRIGGGVRLKVLQAMSMERVIVSTPMGAQGIDIVPERDLLIAHDAREFARVTLTLLDDPERRQRLGRNARQVAANKYAWDKLLPTLDRIYPPSL